MKRRYWIGGVLLVMMLWGMMGCGRAEAPPAGQMVDGPGMMYTPEDQSPFAGFVAEPGWYHHIRGGEPGQFEASGIQVFVNGEPDFASDAWVYKTGYVKLTEGYNDVLLPEPFQLLEFFHSLDCLLPVHHRRRDLYAGKARCGVPEKSSPSGTEKHA